MGAVAGGDHEFDRGASRGVGGGVGEEVYDGLLEEDEVGADEWEGGFDGDVERVVAELVLGGFDGDVADIGEVAPVEGGPDVAGLEAGDVEEVSDETVEAGGSNEDFVGESRGVGGEVLERAEAGRGGGDGGEWGAELVGDGVEEALAEAFGFGEQAGVLFGVAELLAIEDEGDLADEGFEEGTLGQGQGRAMAGAESDDAEASGGGCERLVEGLGGGEGIGGLAGGAAVSEGPGSDAELLVGKREGAEGIGDEVGLRLSRGFGEEDGDVGTEDGSELANDDPEELGQVADVGEFAGEVVEGGRVLFPFAFGGLLGAEAGGELAHGDGDDEEHQEHQAVLETGDVERVDGREEQEVPE